MFQKHDNVIHIPRHRCWGWQFALIPLGRWIIENNIGLRVQKLLHIVCNIDARMAKAVYFAGILSNLVWINIIDANQLQRFSCINNLQGRASYLTKSPDNNFIEQ